jgi:hypothetical protein
MMDSNNIRSEKPRSHCIVFRCSDATYSELMQLVRHLPDVYIVYTKTSRLKIVVSEEGW